MVEWKQAPMSAVESLQRMKYTQVDDASKIVPHSFLIDGNGVLWHAVSKRQYGKKAS